jgi:hypothetical protein
MPDAEPTAAEARPLGKQTLTLVLHFARQTEKCVLPSFVALKRMENADRLSLLKTLVMGALKIDSVPQLRNSSGKTAAVLALDTLARCFYNEADEEDLQAAGFNEAGELHLYVDRASSSSSSSRQQAATGNLAEHVADDDQAVAEH